MESGKILLIADSGSTKTDWALLKAGQPARFVKTIGLNPYFVSGPQMAEIFETSVLEGLTAPFDVYFYGAGLGNAGFRDNYAVFFKERGAEKVVVDTDLMGVAVASLGETTGIAGILGTGANAGFFQQGLLIESPPSMGYVLGDEGSAAWIGKQLLAGFLRNQLPEPLMAYFRETFAVEPSALLRRVYTGERPNQYIAGFAAVISEFPEDPFLQAMLRSGFDAFFLNYIRVLHPRPETPVILTGTVALNNPELLKEQAFNCGFRNFSLLQSVIEGLVRFFGGDNAGN